MKIITEYEELEGKTIAFTHMAQFADQFTIATTSGDILMVNMEDGEVDVFGEIRVVNTLDHSPYLREELAKRGLFDIEAWKEEWKKKQEEARQKREEERKKKELKRLAELKEKYES